MEKLDVYKIDKDNITIKGMYIFDIDFDDESESHKYFLAVSDEGKTGIKQIASMNSFLEKFQHLSLTLSKISSSEVKEIIGSADYGELYETLSKRVRMQNQMAYEDEEFWNKYYSILRKSLTDTVKEDETLLRKFDIDMDKKGPKTNG